VKAESRQKAMVDELNHRVKNTLTTVQSLAAQTIRGDGISEEIRARVRGPPARLEQAAQPPL